MKDQYAGDVNDYAKYSILRALAAAQAGPLTVSWMLTEPDGRSDGRHVGYLDRSERYRPLEPDVFDLLAGIVRRGDRSVYAVEAAGVLPGAAFHSTVMVDSLAARREYFDELSAMLGPDDLVFVDPDNGLETPSTAKGRPGSRKYLYWDEVAQTIGPRRSLCVYQHYPRRPRAAYTAERLGQLASVAPAHGVFALCSSTVAYLVAATPHREQELRSAAEAIAALWDGLLVLITRRAP